MPHAHRWRNLLSVLLGVLLLAGVAPPLLAQSKSERAVRAVIDRLIAANNSVDPAVIRQAITEHSAGAGPFFPAFTERLATLSDLEKQAEEFLAPLAARRFVPTTPISVSVDRRSAWSSFTWRARLTFKDGTRRTFKGRATLVFVKEGRQWKLKHWHSSLPATLPPTATVLEAEVAKILQREREAWEARESRQLASLEGYFADNVSYFDESQAYRIRSKQDALHALEALLTQTELRNWQMLDPEVQVLGDTALLTYYFTESGIAAGKEFRQAGKISVVFVREDGTWRALHYHRSINP
ncbi:MAG: nuclear transport factor 2 family protein [Terriglobia bacterium]